MNRLRYMIIFPMLLIIASVVCGFMSFARAKADMAADLNQALQRTISANAEVTQMLDSLSSMADQPMLTFGARHNGFADFLHISALRDTAGITYTIKNNAEVETGRRNSAQGRICSDTLLLAQMPHSAIEVKAFANPSLLSILKYSNQQWSVMSLACGILLLGLLFVKQRSAMPNSSPSVLAAQCQEQVLALTPMQEKLMQMFFDSPTRTLSKEEICSALWPKKDNPDDTLYTFISRMKSSLAKQSSYRIQNRRGKVYSLTCEDATKQD
ncbi:MAG: helix-turn-helix domain-containing protein [Bacteroidaceae bacterium]|nr:helix-turn-helix domain-containing protein [Bacteroidaceae bacterium]